MKLSARFKITTSAPLLVATPRTEKKPIKWQYIKDGFDIDISLLPKTYAMIGQDSRGIHEIFEIELMVSREESSIPPASDRKERSSFFISIHDDYFKAAEQAINKLFLFFRYKLGNPLVKTIYFYDDNNLCNPEWLDEDENSIDPDFGISTGSCTPARYYDHEFDIHSYEHQKDKEELEKWLNNPEEPTLHEEILCDARDAIVQENYRRAILEMAIACEIYVKQIFFRSAELSSAASDYLESKRKCAISDCLESKRKIEISTIDLINHVSKSIFGESFKEKYLQDYKHIDYLFRARNKIAHLGEVFYQDDSGKKIDIYDDSLMQWWKSIKKLIAWLDENAEKQDS